jgi:hypothetical protein
MSDLNETKQDSGTGVSPNPNETSTGNEGWDANANKPYMRQLGKQYWGDERLTKFDSLNGLVDAYLESTKTKAPEKYDFGEDETNAEELSKTFKELDLSSESATKVYDLIKKARPEKVDTEKVLRERHSDYDTFKKNADKTVNAYMDDSLKELAEKYRLSSNPAFLEFASKIGKELGDDFHNGNNESRTNPKTNVFYELAKKSVGLK